MGSLRLYAIAIDEVRSIFGAPEETAAALRAIAAHRFPATPAVSPGLLAKLGPVFRRAPDAPVLRPGVPSGSDVETLLAGSYVPPHRLSACWSLFETWIDAMAWGSTSLDMTEPQLNEFDFELAKAAVPSKHGLRQLVSTDLGISLRPSPGLAAGFADGDHVAAIVQAWRGALPALADEHRATALHLLEWLDNYPAWNAAAPDRNRPRPDLVTVLGT